MSLPFIRLTDPVYRGHNPRWSFAPTSGEGASLWGGRFNPKGMPALYCSLRPETAWLEAQQGFAFKAQPLTLVAYDVDCADMLDLTDDHVRADVDVDLAELGCAWEDLADQRQEPPTWALARRLIGENCAGILVPSFASGATARDINVVFWDWAPTPPHQVQAIDDEGRLPRNDRSWQ